MKPKKWTFGSIGSVSHGTMRPQDLIPAFILELRYLGHRDKRLTKIERDSQRNDYYELEDLDYDLETLFDMLNEHAPDYMYFGSHPGDGSDYGFWISDELEHDFDGLKVNDTESIPAGYAGHVLHVNDHGNMTLYYKSARKLKEIWGVV